MKKFMNKKTIFSFILGLLLSATTVYATIVMQSSNVEYDYLESNLKDSNENNVEDVQTAIDTLYTLANNQSSSDCLDEYTKRMDNTDRYYCQKAGAITLQRGDVVKMTPTLNTFTTNTAYTGYSITNTINPQLLNLWRVIRVNNNGTYDAVSEYASYEQICFGGGSYDNTTSTNEQLRSVTAYKNYIYYLNLLASKYANTDYTVGTRYMGYYTQTPTLTSISYYYSGSSKAGTDWQGSTSSSTTADEPSGRGDMAYTTDLNLVKEAYNNSAVAYKVDSTGNPTTTKANYYLASRYYYYNGETWFSFMARYIDTNGDLSQDSLRSYTNSNGWFGNYTCYSLRPIITLKSDLTAMGLGTIEDPYVLQ